MTAPAVRGAGLPIVLAVGFLLRLAYVLAQPAVDPAWNRPMLDGLLYLEWARDIVQGQPYDGAFYLAPLYPYLLAGFLRIAGESFLLLYLLQHVAVLVVAGGFGIVAGRVAGPAAATVTAALAVAYQPLMFFASAPVAEPVVLAILAAGLVLITGEWRWRFPVAGLLVGVATLGRPNLLLIPITWAAWTLLRGRRRDALALLCGAAVAILPVMARNFVASGHPVPVSANAGLTAYHGNGPGASGVFTHPRGFSGSPLTQRAEATAEAGRRAGRPLDPVESDRFWGRQALATRFGDVPGTLRLLLVRTALLVDSHEHGLDYDPTLDRNPWRATWHAPRGSELPWVPFGLLLGLAAAGVVARGFRDSGGPWTWCAIAAAAATPLLFYVSSRYRLPMAALLAIPAGCGLTAMWSGELPRVGRRRLAAVAVAVLWLAASLGVPSGALVRAQRAQGLSNLAAAHKAAGDLPRAEALAREALALDPDEPRVRYNLGVVLEAQGRLSEAESHYRAVIRARPDLVEAAGNLAALLIRRGAAGEAVSLLRRALAERPEHATCWNNLVVALAAEGRWSEARAAAREAAAHVALDPDLLRELGDAGPATPEGLEESER